MAGWQNGLCEGLQILLYRFNSGSGLFHFLYLVKVAQFNSSFKCVTYRESLSLFISKINFFSSYGYTLIVLHGKK